MAQKCLTKDADAIAIGDLYRKARKSMVDSMKCLAEAGRKLAAKQESLGHGNWLPWLEANAETLGFETPRTAQRLLHIGRIYDVNVVFDEEEAIRLNQIAWGNEDPAIEPVPEKKPGNKATVVFVPGQERPLMLGGKPLPTMRQPKALATSGEISESAPQDHPAPELTATQIKMAVELADEFFGTCHLARQIGMSDEQVWQLFVSTFTVFVEDTSTINQESS